MSNKSLLKERSRTKSSRPVDNLIRDEEIAGTKMVLQTSYGGECNNSIDADMFQGGNICPGGDLRGRIDVSASMTSEEGDGCSFRRTGDCDGR